MNKLSRIIAFLLTVAMLTVAAGCQKEITSEDLMANIEEQNASESVLDEAFCTKYSGKAFALLKSAYSENEENTVISPLGIYCSMGMLANGASDETLTEVKELFGSSFDCHKMNVYMHSITEKFHNKETSKLYLKNAIWFNSDKNITPNHDFLATAKNYYKAFAYKESFGKDAVTNINNWASNNTDLLAEHLVSDISSDYPMYMLNTTLLDADWESPISPENVVDGAFTNFDKQEEKVQMMSSYEQVYIGSEQFDGFLKYYSGRDYAFVAILPKSMSKNAIGDTMSLFSKGEYFRELITKRKSYTVNAGIPKFSCEYNGGVKAMLQGIEAGSPFSPTYASLNSLGTSDGKIYVGDLNVTTGLSVTERGTSKGTGAKVGDPSVATNVVNIKLDRPFLFAVVDTTDYLPIILGAVTTIRG